MAKTLEQIFEDYYNEPDAAKGQGTGYVGPSVENAREQNDLAKFSPAKQQEFIKNNPIIGQGSGAPSPLQPTATSPLQPTATSPIAAAATPAAPFVAPKKPLSVKTVLETPESAATAKPAADETDKIDWKSYLKESRTKADQTVEDAQKNIARILQEQKEFNAASAKDQSDIEKLYKDFKPIEYKSPKPTSLVEQWGSVAMVFAMLGSLFVRNHATTALNAAAAAMNGFKQGDEAAAKQAYENWKVANENAIKAQEFQTKRYDELLKGLKERQLAQKTITSEELAAYRAEIAAAATSFKDDVMLAAASDKSDLNGMKMTMDLLRQQLTTEQVKKVSGQVQKQQEEEAGNAKFKIDVKELMKMDPEDIAAYVAASGSPDAEKWWKTQATQNALVQGRLKELHNNNDDYKKANARVRLQMEAEAGSIPAEKEILKLVDREAKNELTPDEKSDQAITDNEIALYKTAMPARTGREGSEKLYDATLARVLKLNPNFNPDQYKNVQKIEQDWRSGSTYAGKQLISLNALSGHLGEMNKLINSLDTTDQAQVNKLANAVMRLLADPDLATQDVVAGGKITTDELAKFINMGPGSRGDREDYAKLIDPTGAVSINKENMKILKKYAAEKAKALQNQYIIGTRRDEKTGSAAFGSLLGASALQMYGDDLGVPKEIIEAKTGQKGESNQANEGFTNVTSAAPAAAPAAAPTQVTKKKPAPMPLADYIQYTKKQPGYENLSDQEITDYYNSNFEVK